MSDCINYAGTTICADERVPDGWIVPLHFFDNEGATPMTHLPTDSADRKAIPLVTGVLDYFPDALAAVAKVSKAGNDKHNPGEPLHHARNKSTDHADSMGRHLIDRGGIDPDTGQRHSAELAWRALANLQQELEDAGEANLPRAATIEPGKADPYEDVRSPRRDD